MSRAEGMSSVYFSLISPDKGANIVLDTARILPRMDFHFYGPIEKGYEERFLALVACNSNVYYHGVFPSDSINVVDELKKYDVHLFPTQCPNEGVPGVIVETKMAGLPTVASDRGFNRELITDGVDGILTHDDTAYELASVLGSMLVDPEYVYRMKVAALDSACQFDINQNIDLILKDLSRE
jgi:glycosyltransferase involved in cell wall biosynthesis